MTGAFLAHLHDLFGDAGAVTTRAMFGGHGVYVDGLIVGIAIGEALYLKTDALTRPRFEGAGSAPFVYSGQKKPIETSYWSAPEDALESAQAMRPWIELARAAALRKPAKRRR